MKSIQKTIGYILLFPPLVSVLFFFINIFIRDCGDIISMKHLSDPWTGYFTQNSDNTTAGFSSALPLYFGLMAIAGSYLIKDSSEK